MYKGSKLRLVGIYSKSREEWLLTDIACWMMSITNVPLYDTLGEESICWTFEQTSLSTIFLSCDGISKLANIAKKGKLKTLKNLVCFDEVTKEIRKQADEIGLNLITFTEVINSGKTTYTMPLNFCNGNTFITICYTSGTTGKAKGAVLTHRNFRDNAYVGLLSGVIAGYKYGFTHLSYLPLAHVFERILCYVSIIGGFKVAFYHGDLAKLTEDILVAKPNIFIGVPRVFGKFYESIMSKISPLEGFKRTLIDTAISTKLESYRKDGSITHWLYDKLVFSKIRNAFGGHLKILVSAAAPIDPSMLEMFKILFSAIVIQGYGQTEGAGPLAISYYDDTYPGSSGPPMQCSIAKVVDVPEMEYFSTDIINGQPTPRGELCIKGTNLSKEYFKDPERTALMYDSEGWYHTGDVALITPTGGIKIIDRIKNLFKLQQGEYVAPEKIENVLSTSPWVMQLFVHGNSFQTYLIAILVPNKEAVMKWGENNKVSKSYEELCKDLELNKAVLKDLSALGYEKGVLLVINLLASWL
jgi:long-chain acyl-CoA synthetase